MRALNQAVLARLRALPHGNGIGPEITVYGGEVPAAVPLADDDTGRVAPYVVLFAGRAPVDGRGEDLADSHTDSVWTGQLTVAAGYDDDAAEAADRVHAWVHRWAPPATGDLAGLTISGLRPPPGYQTGPVRRDRDTTPARFWLPLQYQSTVTR